MQTFFLQLTRPETEARITQILDEYATNEPVFVASEAEAPANVASEAEAAAAESADAEAAMEVVSDS